MDFALEQEMEMEALEAIPEADLSGAQAPCRTPPLPPPLPPRPDAPRETPGGSGGSAA